MKKLLKVVKQTRNDPGRRPSQGSNSFFYICKKYNFLKFHQFYSPKMYLKGYAEDWKITFSSIVENKTSQKTKKFFVKFFMNPPVSRIVSKTLRSPPCS